MGGKKEKRREDICNELEFIITDVTKKEVLLFQLCTIHLLISHCNASPTKTQFWQPFFIQQKVIQARNNLQAMRN